MNQPRAWMVCTNEDCAYEGVRDEVPGMIELGHLMCLFEADEECPECGARREIEG